MWATDNERDDWYAHATWEDPDFPQDVKEHRVKALVNLYAILSHLEYREVIWGDQKVREALLSSGEASCDHVVRCLAVGCLVKLSEPRANRKAMLEDEQTRTVLCVSAARDAPEDVRLRAFVVLGNLCVQLRGCEDTNIGRQLIRAIVVGIDKRQQHSVRIRAAGALWSMASSAANLQAMWKNLDIRYAILASVSSEDGEAWHNVEVRSSLLGVLWTLAGEEMNREPMWQDEGTRKALLASACADQPSRPRVNALNALRSFGATVKMQRRLWRNEEVKVLVLQAASVGQPADVRASALKLLIQLSFDARNAVEMVPGIRDMLYQASDDEQLDDRERRDLRFGADRLWGAELWEAEEDEEEEAAAPEAEEPAVEGAEAEQPDAPEGGVLQTGVLDRAAEHGVGEAA